MQFGIISIFPEIFTALEYGIIGKAIKKQQVSIQHFKLNNYLKSQSERLDDKPYGGGAGMLLRYEPLKYAIEDALSTMGANTPVIYLSPKGKQLRHTKVQSLAKTTNNIIIICGRYEGIDERIIDKYVDLELSIGDYILSGGEYAAMILIDSVARHLPGVLGNAESTLEESFYNNQLEYPQYTRPANIDEMQVPEVLLQGNHQAIATWRQQISAKITKDKRPDLLKNDSHSQ